MEVITWTLLSWCVALTILGGVEASVLRRSLGSNDSYADNSYWINDGGYENSESYGGSNSSYFDDNTQVTPNCGGNYTIYTNEVVYIESPNYPYYNYHNNEDCMWLISSWEGKPLIITSLQFDTEDAYDSLEIGSGFHGILGEFSGYDANVHVTGPPNVWITFKSDFSVTRSGFQLAVTTTEGNPAGKGGCGETGVTKKWRDDARCGYNYTLSDGRPSECDPYGEYPCCSPFDWCGNTRWHCECDGCVDYS